MTVQLKRANLAQSISYTNHNVPVGNMSDAFMTMVYEAGQQALAGLPCEGCS
jgi:hypothetical protein